MNNCSPGRTNGQFGFPERKPCIFLKLNKVIWIHGPLFNIYFINWISCFFFLHQIYNWVPKVFNETNPDQIQDPKERQLYDRMPHYLKEAIATTPDREVSANKWKTQTNIWIFLYQNTHILNIFILDALFISSEKLNLGIVWRWKSSWHWKSWSSHIFTTSWIPCLLLPIQKCPRVSSTYCSRSIWTTKTLVLLTKTVLGFTKKLIKIICFYFSHISWSIN